MIQNESRDPFDGNVYHVTMQITFLTRKIRNGERYLHCDVVHITTKWVSSLTLDCNGVFAIKAYGAFKPLGKESTLLYHIPQGAGHLSPLVKNPPLLYHTPQGAGHLIKAKMYAISNDTHQLQCIKLHHFKLERFKSI